MKVSAVLTGSTVTGWVRIVLPSQLASAETTDELIRVKYGGTPDAGSVAPTTTLSGTNMPTWAADMETASGSPWAGTGDHTSYGGAVADVGKIGNALSCDGVDDYLVAGSESQFDFAGAFSLEAWVYPTVSDINYTKGIIAKNSDADANGFGLGHYHDNWLWWISGSSILSTSSFSLNTWHHVVGTFDGSTLHLYVDGGEIGTPASATLSNNNAPLTIGRWIREGAVQRFWTGSLDDARIYSRALSPAEIAYHVAQVNSPGTWGAEISLATARRWPWQIRRTRRLAGTR